MSAGQFVAVEGPTGVGKTTLARRLATELDATVVLDPYESNLFLPQLAVSDPDPALGLRVELTFVALRVAQLRDIAALLASGDNVVADWALMKQEVFAASVLDAADTARVAATVGVWASSVPAPDLLIGMSAPPATLQARIRSRGRVFEASLTHRYLAGLAAGFARAFAAWPGRLLPVAADTVDSFDNDHIRDLARQVRSVLIPVEAQ